MATTKVRSKISTVDTETVQRVDNVKFTDKELSQANKLPYVLLRYAKKITRDAAIPTAVLAIAKYFNLWENYVLHYNLFTSLPSYLSSYLPSFITSMAITSTIFQWMSSEVFLFVFLTVLLHEIVYFYQVLFYATIDSFNLLSNFKLKRSEGLPNPSRTLIRNTLYEIPVNHFFFQPLILFSVFPLFKFFGSETFTTIPPLLTCFYQFIWISILNDCLHYIIHRSMHHPSLFAYHKKHHQYKKPICIATDYCSFIQRITLNFLPVIIGPMILGTHLSIWLAWMMLRTYESIEAHSGYEIPYLGFNTSRFHDFHQTRNLGNYGIGDFWDSICHTNTAYLRHLEKIKDVQPVHS